MTPLTAHPVVDTASTHVAITLHSDALQAFCNTRIAEHLHRRMLELLLPADAQLLLFDITSTFLQRYEDYIRGGDNLLSDGSDTDAEILQTLEDLVMGMSHRLLPVLFVPMDLKGQFMVIAVKY